MATASSGAGLGNAGAVVELRRSTVCDGWGVFAATDIPANTTVTRYDGRLCSTIKGLDVEDAVYAYVFAPRADAGRGGGETTCMYIIGQRDASAANVTERGIGQFLNDAIHPEITGRKNNCRFVESADYRLYIATKRPIRAGEELLVSYHLSYWIGLLRKPRLLRKLRIPRELVDWTRCHKNVEDLLRRQLHRGISLDAYIGVRLVNDDDETKGLAQYAMALPRCSIEAIETICSCAVLDAADDDNMKTIVWEFLLELDDATTRVSCRCAACDCRLASGPTPTRKSTPTYLSTTFVEIGVIVNDAAACDRP